MFVKSENNDSDIWTKNMDKKTYARHVVKFMGNNEWQNIVANRKGVKNIKHDGKYFIFATYLLTTAFMGFMFYTRDLFYMGYLVYTRENRVLETAEVLDLGLETAQVLKTVEDLGQLKS